MDPATRYFRDQVLRAGLTVRDYGFFVDNTDSTADFPENTTTRQVYPSNMALNPMADIYFPGFDMNNADYYLCQEWAREFDANPATSDLSRSDAASSAAGSYRQLQHSAEPGEYA